MERPDKCFDWDRYCSCTVQKNFCSRLADGSRSPHAFSKLCHILNRDAIWPRGCQLRWRNLVDVCVKQLCRLIQHAGLTKEPDFQRYHLLFLIIIPEFSRESRSCAIENRAQHFLFRPGAAAPCLPRGCRAGYLSSMQVVSIWPPGARSGGQKGMECFLISLRSASPGPRLGARVAVDRGARVVAVVPTTMACSTAQAMAV